MFNLAKSYILFFFSHKKAESIREAIFRTSLINLFARIFGYLRQLSIAILFGFNYHTDAFFMALSLIGLFLIFADVFDSLGVPNLVFTRQKGEEEFKRLAGLLFTFTTILSVSLTMLCLVLIPILIRIPIGFDQKAKESLETAILFLIPYLFFNFFFHHFSAVLRSLRRFTAYFVGELIFSLSAFLTTFLGLYHFNSFVVLPISLSLSQAIATVYMIYTGKEFLHFKFYIDEQTKSIIKHFFYLLALYGVFHLFIVVDRIFASLLGEKGISALTYGSMLAFAVGAIIKLPLMSITTLAETKGSLKTINKFAKFSLFISLPTTLFLFFFSHLPVDILFGHGKFTKMDVGLTATALKYYSLSLFFYFFWQVLYRAFQVLSWLKPVFFVAIIGVIINGLANYVFVLVFRLGIAGICLGTFLAYAFISLTSYLLLYRREKIVSGSNSTSSRNYNIE